MLKQAILVLNGPKHRRHSGTPKGLGYAFSEYVTRYPSDHLPHAGGVDATVGVTMTLDNLLSRSEAPAYLDTGDPITRFHTKAQRIAIAHRDRHCTADGCDWPAALCHVHHNTPWSRGGKTTVNDGRMLCPRHHSYAHSPEYEMKTVPNGRVIFSRT